MAEIRRRKEHKWLSPEQKLRRSRNLFIGLFSASVILAVSLFIYNYNYMAFKLLITGHYINTDALDEIYTEQLGQSYKGDLHGSFDYAVMGVFTDKIREVAGDDYTYLYTPPELTAERAATSAIAKETEIRALSANTVYMRLPNVSEESKKYIADNTERLKGYKNIVIDLRSNYGGSLNMLYELSELFLPENTVIGREVTRSALFTKTALTRTKQELSYEGIVILIDGGTASAAEGFTMSLRENLPNVTTMGGKSFGKGIGQITWPLFGDYALKATVLRVETPSGGSVHKTGITPDIEYEQDDIIQHAADYLENGDQ